MEAHEAATSGQLSFVAERVHSIAVDAADCFTLPSSLAFALFTPSVRAGGSGAAAAYAGVVSVSVWRC